MKKLCVYMGILSMLFSFSVISCKNSAGTSTDSGGLLVRDLVQTNPLHFRVFKKNSNNYSIYFPAGVGVFRNQSFTEDINANKTEKMQFDYTLNDSGINATVYFYESNSQNNKTKVLDNSACIVKKCTDASHGPATCLMLETQTFSYKGENYKIQLHTKPFLQNN